MIDTRALADTSVLVRSVRRVDRDHLRTVAAIRRLQEEGTEFVLATQNLVEFWAVATRPEGDNGLGYTTRDVALQIDRFLTALTLLPDPDDTYVRWRELVERYGVSGKTTHDARLVATVLANGVTRVLTLNAAHFARFAEITVEVP